MIKSLPSPSVMRAHTWPLAKASCVTPLTSVRALTALWQLDRSKEVMVARPTEPPSAVKEREPISELLPGHSMNSPTTVASTRAPTITPSTILTRRTSPASRSRGPEWEWLCPLWPWPRLRS